MNSTDDLKKDIETFNEMHLYFVINEIGGFIWRMNHDMADGRIPEASWTSIHEDIKKMAGVQRHAIDQLPRIGVTKPLHDQGEAPNAKPTPEYWAWFRWWDSYIKGLTEEDWKTLDKKLKDKEDTSSYRPSGDWHDRIPEEEENAKKSEEFWKSRNNKE